MKKLEVQALDRIGKNWSKASETRKAALQHTKAFAAFVGDKFGLERIENIKPHMVEAYVANMKAQGLSSGTMNNRLIAVRNLAEAIGKQNIVHRHNRDYGIERDRKHPVLQNTEQVARVREALNQMANTGDKVAMMASAAADMRDAFGLRIKESLMSSRIEGGRLVVEGTKGGRPRSVEIRTQAQINAVAKLHATAATLGSGTGRIIPPSMSLKQAYDAQRDMLHRLGSTKANCCNPHASRHNYAQTRTAEGASKTHVAEELGHGREEVVGYYVPD